MRRSLVVLLTLFALASSASAASVGVVTNFGPPLATDCPLPEGIAAAPDGTIYASSANFGSTGPSAKICVFSPEGEMIDTIWVAPGPGGMANLLGMLFVPGEGLYVADFADGGGNGRVLRVDPGTHAATTIATGFRSANALAKDNAGNLYVSDSFAGSVTRIARDGSTHAWTYAELAPAGFPPFGANGLAFDRTESYLYVANTSVDTVYRIAFAAGVLGAIEPFATGIDGADGIAFDARGTLYVCANQADRIVALAADGSVAATYAGTGANAFHFPASLVFRGRDVFVANTSFLDGGTNSKLSHFIAPFPGAPLRP